MSEQQPLLRSEGDVEDGGTPAEGSKGWREWMSEKLETKFFHKAVIALARPFPHFSFSSV